MGHHTAQRPITVILAHHPVTADHRDRLTLHRLHQSRLNRPLNPMPTIGKTCSGTWGSMMVLNRHIPVGQIPAIDKTSRVWEGMVRGQ